MTSNGEWERAAEKSLRASQERRSQQSRSSGTLSWSLGWTLVLAGVTILLWQTTREMPTPVIVFGSLGMTWGGLALLGLSIRL